jgi:hypothetical protein
MEAKFARQECHAAILCENCMSLLYCCDPHYDLCFTIPSLPVIFSFIYNPSERRNCDVPNSEALLSKLDGVKSPCIINVKACTVFKVGILQCITVIQCSSRSSLLYRTVLKMSPIQWVTSSISNNFFICQRILPRFSVDFGFILLNIFLEVDLVFFSRNLSGNAISVSLSFSNFIRHELTECINNVVCVSASHAQRTCAFMDNVCICE